MMNNNYNPYSSKDEQFSISAQKAAQTLWEACEGDVSRLPDSYLENFQYNYSDGNVCLLDQLNKVSMSEGTYEEFSEVVRGLVSVNPEEWPEKDSILSISSDRLRNPEEVADFSELFEDLFTYAETDGMSSKVNKFLSKIISTVYLDGVGLVTDKEGNPPNKENKFLLTEEGFSGVFYDKDYKSNKKKFPFEIKENSEGNFDIVY